MKRPTVTCRRKIRYSNVVAAFRELIELGTAGGGDVGLEIYSCEVCGGLHIGHNRSYRKMYRRIGLNPRKPIIWRLVARLNRKS